VGKEACPMISFFPLMSLLIFLLLSEEREFVRFKVKKDLLCLKSNRLENFDLTVGRWIPRPT
jgi:uncharacterized membrane protein